MKYLSSKVCVPNETKDLKLHAFNMITGISNQKHWEKIYQSNVNVSLIEGNNNKCWCKCKNPKEHRMCEKNIFGILQHVAAKIADMYEEWFMIQWLCAMKLWNKQKLFQQKLF